MASQSANHGSANLHQANLKSRLISKDAFVDGELGGELDLIELKLPSVLRTQNKAFDPNTYEVEDPIVFKNDKGVETEKVCMIEDIIRWRIAPNQHRPENQDFSLTHLDKKLEIDQASHAKVESNTKIVQWSDGSYSLAIGDEFFEINMENLTNRQFYAQFEKFLLFKGSINKKMIVKPPPKSQKNHLRFIKRINEAQQKVQQAQITVALKETKSAKQLQRVGKPGISTNYQIERGDDLGKQVGVKRTLEQAKADLEGDDYDDNSMAQGQDDDHAMRSSKRFKQAAYSGADGRDGFIDKRYNEQQSQNHQNYNSSNQSNLQYQQQQQQEEDDDGEEYYQDVAQIENKDAPAKAISDSDSSDEDGLA